MYDMTTITTAAPATDDQRAPLQAASLLALIERIAENVDAETEALRDDPKFDLKSSNVRKSRHLYELGRAFKNVNRDELGPQHHEAMAILRTRLQRNEAAIKAHLSAVSEIASIIQDVIERAQADGTYSANAFGSG
ncbi:hypothetical protein [Nitratireductor thuwali]|uniref:Flagellar protein FlgN n=1 Tax=Nitratireductor thuwali TaxID=2267699 RepID=A0ABY5MI42_9HYPH|nr:hypothetical protein NTH_01283 [Nitratireductor thuwali]